MNFNPKPNRSENWNHRFCITSFTKVKVEARIKDSANIVFKQNAVRRCH